MKTKGLYLQEWITEARRRWKVCPFSPACRQSRSCSLGGASFSAPSRRRDPSRSATSYRTLTLRLRLRWSSHSRRRRSIARPRRIRPVPHRPRRAEHPISLVSRLLAVRGGPKWPDDVGRASTALRAEQKKHAGLLPRLPLEWSRSARSRSGCERGYRTSCDGCWRVGRAPAMPLPNRARACWQRQRQNPAVGGLDSGRGRSVARFCEEERLRQIGSRTLMPTGKTHFNRFSIILICAVSSWNVCRPRSASRFGLWQQLQQQKRTFGHVTPCPTRIMRASSSRSGSVRRRVQSFTAGNTVMSAWRRNN